MKQKLLSLCPIADKEVEAIIAKFYDIDVMAEPTEEKVLAAIAEAGPKRIVYVSCDVATQARDAKYLCSHGYKATRCQSVDMFCLTGHIENVLLFEKA